MNGFDLYKTCTGPSHAQPTRLPLSEDHWNFHRSGRLAGQPIARCKLCTNWNKLIGKDGPHGLVEPAVLVALIKELSLRCDGLYRVQKAHGIAATTLKSILDGNHAKVQKRTAARVIVALGEQRKIDRRNGASAAFIAARRAQVQREQNMHLLAGY